MKLHSETVERNLRAIRVALALALVPLLIWLSLQTDHARLKGQPMEAWRVVPLIACAVAAALIGKRYLNPVAGMFLSGIGGAVATGTDAGPYGGVVGLVVGAIVVLLPVMHKPAKRLPQSNVPQ